MQNPPILVKIVHYSMKTADFVDFEKLQILENRESTKTSDFYVKQKTKFAKKGNPYILYLKMNSIFYADLSIIHCSAPENSENDQLGATKKIILYYDCCKLCKPINV